ncbi:acyl-CoA dehydrogenase family protein [Streptomyces avidinii]
MITPGSLLPGGTASTPTDSIPSSLIADNRVNRIYGGTSEVMKSIIAKSMGL